MQTARSTAERLAKPRPSGLKANAARTKLGERFEVTTMWWASSNKFVAQAIRFGVVGVKNNIIYYFLYVVLSLVGIGHSLAVVVVYAFGLAYSFLFNKNFVFKDRGNSTFKFAKYGLVYLLGLSVNLTALRVLTVDFGVNHFVAQGLLILLVSAIVFILLRTLVFEADEGWT